MKKALTTIFLIIMILTVVGGVFVPQQAEAGIADVLICITNPGACAAKTIIMSVASEISYAIMTIVSWFLTLAGLVLNISIVLTMNIKAIYEATPAIEQVWIVIRNISSIFIIFFLLYTSIMTIIGSESSSVKKLVGKIIIAGLLINFSLFFTKILIDASNLVSLQFYRAIAPQAQNTLLSGNFNAGNLLSSSYYDGGISNIFLQSLKVPAIYNKNKGIITGVSDNDFFKITVSTIAGSLLMIFAALSFLAASIAFIIRLVILLLLMGFSPVFFVGMIFPQIEQDISKKWTGWLKKELIFMPVYLLFMYVALKFLSTTDGKGFFAMLDTGRQGAGNDATGGVLLSTVGLILQYAIAFILINIPLIAALQTGGLGVKWGDTAKKWVGGYIGKNTAGRLASKADKYLENTKFGNSAVVRNIRGITTQKAANAKWGGYSSRKDDEKETKERQKKGRDIDNIRRLDRAIATGNHPEIKTIISNMSNSEIANLNKDKLTHPHVIPHLSSTVYANVEKSEKTDADKVAILEARTKELSKAIGASDTNKIKAIVKNMNGEDLQKYIENNTPIGTPISDNLIAHIRESQLKDMDGMNDIFRKQIGRSIDLWIGKFISNHPAYNFIDKNRPAWT